MIPESLRSKVAPLAANASIVLVRPKYAENVGAAARIVRNMGFGGLILVRDERPAEEPMRKMATHHAADVLDAMTIHPDVESALAPFAFAVAATARTGRMRRGLATPREMGGRLVELLAHNRVALVFGSEDRGLTNDDLRPCNLLVTIPTLGTASLNLAQAVAVLSYELVAGLIEAHRSGPVYFRAKLAPSQELEKMYGHIETVLQTIGFLREEDKDYWMRGVRRFLGRVGLRSREVRIIRGVCRQFLWHMAGNRPADGQRTGGKAQEPPTTTEPRSTVPT